MKCTGHISYDQHIMEIGVNNHSAMNTGVISFLSIYIEKRVHVLVCALLRHKDMYTT